MVDCNNMLLRYVTCNTWMGSVNNFQNFLFLNTNQVFKQMGVRQIVPPNQKPLANPKKKIALLGGGPASLSCATFLARLGYKDVTIYEKRNYLGGLR